MTKRTMKAEDLYKAKVISFNRLSPDGKHIAFTVTELVREDNNGKKEEKKYTNLYLLNTETSKTSRLTRGKHHDYRPIWHPNNEDIYFASTRGQNGMQIYKINIHGGEAEQITDIEDNVMIYNISPDGKRMVINTHEKRDKDDTYLRITKSYYKVNGLGYFNYSNCNILTLNLSNGRIRRIAGPETLLLFPIWMPDSKHIVFTANRTDDWFKEPWEGHFYKMKAVGGSDQQIDTFTGYQAHYYICISPDGRYMAFTGMKSKYNVKKYTRIYIQDLTCKKPPVCINPDSDYEIRGNVIVGDTEGSHMEFLKWGDDSRSLYFRVNQRGSVNLKRIDIETLEEQSVIEHKGNIGNFDIKGNMIYFFHNNMTNPGEICSYNMETEKKRAMTSINSWTQNIKFGEIEEIELKKGESDIHGWIMKPPKFDKTKKYPSILEIHGGPHCMYGYSFMHEFHFLTAQGYIVHFCNPRGSSGYGEESKMATSNSWNEPAYSDLMKWTDYIQRKKYMDGRRMGVTGGSYGGYMTSWIITQTKRFKAAVVQRSVTNLYDYNMSSSWNIRHRFAFNNIIPFENPMNYFKQSPVFYAGNIKTPTMIIHSMRDYGATLSQAEQLYTALKYRGIDSELILFPDESHGLSRGGRTDRRICRLNHILRWFDKYLKD
ncbi:MAG: S9 family peptidase [bacterium]